jgi:purine-cytosine permease-like protein
MLINFSASYSSFISKNLFAIVYTIKLIASLLKSDWFLVRRTYKSAFKT